MTSGAERRRALLGEKAVARAREIAQQAPAPGRALYESLALLLRSARIPVASSDDEQPRDDVA